MSNIFSIKGIKNLSLYDNIIHKYLYNKITNILNKYNFNEIKLSILENINLFKKINNNINDKKLFFIYNKKI